MLKEPIRLDALVLAVGGGSHAFGAISVSRELRPDLPVYGVQAKRASAIHDSWHRGVPVKKPCSATIAEGLATTQTYEFTFSGLCDGLTDFVTVSEEELFSAWRLIVVSTHNLAEVAGAAGFAGLVKLRSALRNQQVGIVLTGANISLGAIASMLMRYSRRGDSNGSGRPDGRIWQ